MRDIKKHEIPGDKNSLQYWTQYVNPLRVSINFVVIYFCRFLPSMRLKSYFYRLLGMKVGKNVSVGLMAMFDIFFPQLIELEDNCIIGYNSTILAHDFMVDYWTTGEVVVGKSTTIGANSTILAGVKIGEKTVVGAGSLVNSHVPDNVFAAGVPVRVMEVDIGND